MGRHQRAGRAQGAAGGPRPAPAVAAHYRRGIHGVLAAVQRPGGGFVSERLRERQSLGAAPGRSGPAPGIRVPRGYPPFSALGASLSAGFGRRGVDHARAGPAPPAARPRGLRAPAGPVAHGSHAAAARASLRAGAAGAAPARRRRARPRGAGSRLCQRRGGAGRGGGLVRAVARGRPARSLRRGAWRHALRARSPGDAPAPRLGLSYGALRQPAGQFLHGFHPGSGPAGQGRPGRARSQR